MCKASTVAPEPSPQCLGYGVAADKYLIVMEEPNTTAADMEEILSAGERIS